MNVYEFDVFCDFFLSLYGYKVKFTLMKVKLYTFFF